MRPTELTRVKRIVLPRGISNRMSIFRPGRNLDRATRWRLLGLLVVLALLPCNVQAQSTSSFDEVGRFYVQNFAPQDYDAHGQNWAIVQSPEGLLYVANGAGVLEYDGVSWRLILTSNRRKSSVAWCRGARQHIWSSPKTGACFGA